MLELGGAQQNTLYTVTKLDREKYAPYLIAGEGGPLRDTAENIDGCPAYFVPELVRPISPVNDVVALLAIRRILARIVAESGGAPVVVHTHSSKAGIIGRWAAYLAGARVIVHTVHGFGFNDEQPKLKRAVLVAAERLTSCITDYFVAVAEDNVDKGVAERIFPATGAAVIRSGIDTDYFAEAPADIPAVRARMGIPANAPMVANISCLKPQKAPVDSVRVAAKVLERVPDAWFVHAGDGALKDDMLSEAKRLGIADRYLMLGWRTDVRDIIHASDALLLPSLWEGLPRVALQAMAAGKPVVATAVDGTPEAVKDGVTGFLASPHDVDGMAEKLAMLLADRGLAARMGEAGRARVGEFGQDEMVRRIERLYKTMLEGKR